jgi:hypothetical protein
MLDEDDASVGAAVLGRVAVGLNAELGDGIDDGVEGDLAGFGLEDADAVVDVLADARTAAVDPGQDGAGREIDARQKGHERDEVAAVQGKGHDALLLDGEACGAGAGAQQRGFGADFEDFRDFAEFEAEVETKAVAEAEFDGGVAQWAEAVHFGGEAVLAWWKGEELKLAGGSSPKAGGGSGSDALQCDGGVGDWEAGGVADRAAEFSES